MLLQIQRNVERSIPKSMAKEGEREDCPAAHLITTTGLAARIALAAAQSVLQIDDSGVRGGSRKGGLDLVPSAEMDRRALAVHGLYRSPDPLAIDPVDVEHSPLMATRLAGRDSMPPNSPKAVWRLAVGSGAAPSRIGTSARQTIARLTRAPQAGFEADPRRVRLRVIVSVSVLA